MPRTARKMLQIGGPAWATTDTAEPGRNEHCCIAPPSPQRAAAGFLPAAAAAHAQQPPAAAPPKADDVWHAAGFRCHAEPRHAMCHFIRSSGGRGRRSCCRTHSRAVPARGCLPLLLVPAGRSRLRLLCAAAGRYRCSARRCRRIRCIVVGCHGLPAVPLLELRQRPDLRLAPPAGRQSGRMGSMTCCGAMLGLRHVLCARACMLRVGSSIKGATMCSRTGVGSSGWNISEGTAQAGTL